MGTAASLSYRGCMSLMPRLVELNAPMCLIPRFTLFSLKKECSVDLDLSSLSTSLQEWIRFAEDTNPVV